MVTNFIILGTSDKSFFSFYVIYFHCIWNFFSWLLHMIYVAVSGLEVSSNYSTTRVATFMIMKELAKIGDGY